MRTTLLVLSLLVLAACGGGDDYVAPAGTSPGPSASAGEGLATSARVLNDEEAKRLLGSYCTVCHSLDRVKRTNRALDDWCTHVQRMIDKPNGALIGDSDAAALANYLSKKYGK